MMVEKKIFYICMMVFLSVILINPIVSAGLFDSIKKIFGGEPQLAPFNASVTIQSLPPSIRTVVNISDDSSASTIDQVMEVPDRKVNVEVVFIANDPNSKNDLPAGGPITFGLAAKNIGINITYTGAHADTVSNTPYVASVTPPLDRCDELVSCNNLCTGDERMYVCNLSQSMDFYFEPSVVSPSANKWTVGISITDGTSNIGHNTTKNFSYLANSDVLNINNLTWVGLNPLIGSRMATQNVTIINKGNLAISTVTITGYNLTGNNYPTKPKSYIPADAIRVYDVIGSECIPAPPAITLKENTGLVVTLVSALQFNASAQKDLRFCIFNALNLYTGGVGPLDLSDNSYNAVGNNFATLGTADWRLIL